MFIYHDDHIILIRIIYNLLIKDMAKSNHFFTANHSVIAYLIIACLFIFAPTQAYTQAFSTSSGSEINAFPFDRLDGKKTQFLYIANDFNLPSSAPEGYIKSISFRGDGTSAGTYSNIVIRLGQTNDVAFNSSFYEGALTEVYNRSSVVLTFKEDNWFVFTLDTPFPYDPGKSLVIDIEQTGILNNEAGISILQHTVPGNRRTWSAGGAPFVYSSQNGSIADLEIFIIDSLAVPLSPLPVIILCILVACIIVIIKLKKKE